MAGCICGIAGKFHLAGVASQAYSFSYRVTAESIRHGGAWNQVQKLGERISEEEEDCVKQMEAGRSERAEGVPMLFEEMDGAWLSMQDSANSFKRVRK